MFFLRADLGFQSSVTPIMEGIVDLHNHIFFFLILVFVFVFWIFGNILYHFWWRIAHPRNGGDLDDRVTLAHFRHLSHSTALEVVWTILPSFILVAIAVPSFALLYAMDEIMEPTLTLKVVGHQWYWNYQYSNCISQLHYDPSSYPELMPQSLWDRVWSNAAHVASQSDLGGDLEVSPSAIAAKVFQSISSPVSLAGRADSLPSVQFDSYMLNEDELLSAGDYRLLEVDEPIVLPTNSHIRFLITADDVIHSFAVPQLGIKVDAVPGRLNQQGVFLKRRGVFYGQCSELCGVNHGFMPIVIKAVSMKEFVHWYLHKLDALHPDSGLSLADASEVEQFIANGTVPARFADSALPPSLPSSPNEPVPALPAFGADWTVTDLGDVR